MIVDQLELRDDAPGVERSARIRWRGGELRVFITTEPELARPGPDGSAFVCACLLPAMRLGEDLEVDGPVSPLLMRGLARAHDLYRAWDPSLHEVAVHEADESDRTPEGLASDRGRRLESRSRCRTTMPICRRAPTCRQWLTPWSDRCRASVYAIGAWCA